MLSRFKPRSRKQGGLNGVGAKGLPKKEICVTSKYYLISNL